MQPAARPRNSSSAAAPSRRPGSPQPPRHGEETLGPHNGRPPRAAPRHGASGTKDLPPKMAETSTSTARAAEDEIGAKALAEIVECADRLRKSFILLHKTFLDATNRLSKSADNSVSKEEWADISFILDNVSSHIERVWEEQIRRKEQVPPKESAMYRLTSAIAWDLSEFIAGLTDAQREHLYAGGPIDKDMRMDVLFSGAAAGLYPTYARSEKTGAPTSRYTKRASVPGSTDFTYPDYQLHLSDENKHTYYSLAIPYGRLIACLREYTTTGALPPYIGGTMIAAVAYSWYEAVISSILYYSNLNKYFDYLRVADPANAERYARESTFAFVFQTVRTCDSALTGKDVVRWHGLFRDGRRSSYAACSAYAESVLSRAGKKDLLAGIDPSEFASDPSRLQGIIKNMIGVDVTPDMLKTIPGVGDLIKTFTGGKTA